MPAGRGQEGDGVARGRCVDHDQVGSAPLLELLHLAQHQHVADARNGGRHHVEHAGPGQPPRHPPQAVAFEILDQRVIGRDPPTPDRALAPAGRIPPQDRLLVLEVARPPEGAGQAGLALELDDEHRKSGLSSHPGQRCRHGRLAHTTLAGDDEDVALCGESRRVHRRRA